MNALISIMFPLWLIVAIVLFFEGLWVFGLLVLIIPIWLLAAFIRRNLE